MPQSIRATCQEIRKLRKKLKAAERVCAMASRIVRPVERQSKANAPLEYDLFEALTAWDAVR